MRIVALVVCILFILWLVIRDVRRRPSVSNAMWIPIALLLILGSRQVSSWMSSSGPGVYEESGFGNDQARSPLDQLFWLIILSSSFVIATRRGVKWARILAANPTVVAFYLYFLVSVSWSGDPVGSLKRIVKDFGLIFVIGLIFSEKDPFQSLRAVYARCAFILFPLSVLFIRYYPALGRAYTVAGEPMATGVTMQKNSLGEIVLIFTLFLVWDYMEELRAQKKFRWGKIPWEKALLVLMGLYLLQQSQSRSGLLCLCVGSALIIRGRPFVSKAINRTVLSGAISLPVLLFFSQRFSSVIAPIVAAMGRDMTFTGRTDIWQHINSATVSPLIGAGYWNFWGGPGGYAICEAMRTGVNNAHCGYMDMYLDGGIIGLCMLLILLVSCGSRLIRNLRMSADTMRFERLRFALLIIAIIYNLSETAFARVSCIWFTVLMALVTIPPMKVRARKTRLVLTDVDQAHSMMAVSNRPA